MAIAAWPLPRDDLFCLLPFFEYTLLKGYQPKQDYTVEEIKTALQTLTSYDFENLSESSFEAILEAVYYPELLYILINPRLTPALFEILMLYPQDHSALSFSFGYLAFQCLALATSVGLLAQNGELDPFVKSIDPATREARTDISPLMTTWLMDMFNKDMDIVEDRPINITTRLGWTFISGKPTCLVAIGGHNFTSTMHLLVQCFLGRGGTLKAYTSMRALGWPALLIVMWTHIKRTDVMNRVLYIANFREIVLRYCLVSAPTEHFVMQNLMGMFAGLERLTGGYPPPLNTFNVLGMDAINIKVTFVEQLSFCQVDPTSANLTYLISLTDYALQVLDKSGFPNLLEIIKAAPGRLWHEIAYASKSLEEDFSENVISFAIPTLHAVVKHFPQRGILEQILGPSQVTEMISTLVEVEFVNVLGRLLLLPLTATSRKTNFTFASAVTINETLRVIFSLTQQFSQRHHMSHTLFGNGYLDWLKTLNYMGQLRSTPIRQVPPYQGIRECILVWTQLRQECAEISCSRLQPVEKDVTGKTHQRSYNRLMQRAP
ncbi:hypothetical protein BDV93DRAFT_516275 [Ceratobasidium sp. AG-I]|nr:hypothetical protein BDV93DRAFT_516275 [Ceratobasidium sp. AG-I]